MRDVELTTTRPGRRRALRAVATTLFAALLFSITVYLSSPGLRAWLVELFSRPAPYGTVGPVHLEHGAPWGILTVDGRRVDAAGLEMSFDALSLAPGAHRLVYTAALFPTLDCVISAEAQALDTCPLMRDLGWFEQNVILRGPGRIVNLGATAGQLEPSDQESLTGAIASYLATRETTETVTVGERYRVSAEIVAMTTMPLTARLIYHLNYDTRRSLPPRADAAPCVTLCYGSSGITAGPDGAPVWGIGAHVVVQWAYGAGEEAPEIAAPAPTAVTPDEEIELFVRWLGVGHWQVGAQEILGHTPICSVALRQLLDAGAQFAPNVEMKVVTAKNPARGCFIAGLSPSPYAAPMRFLYRFGVVLTLDQATHAHLPALPEATPAERDIAAEIEGEAR